MTPSASKYQMAARAAITHTTTSDMTSVVEDRAWEERLAFLLDVVLVASEVFPVELAEVRAPPCVAPLRVLRTRPARAPVGSTGGRSASGGLTGPWRRRHAEPGHEVDVHADERDESAGYQEHVHGHQFGQRVGPDLRATREELRQPRPAGKEKLG